jgi:hypothetical protein
MMQRRDSVFAFFAKISNSLALSNSQGELTLSGLARQPPYSVFKEQVWVLDA